MNTVIKNVDVVLISEMLNEKSYMKEMLAACVSCGMCAESCFYYKNTGEKSAIPSFKVKNTVGRLFRKKGRVTRAELEGMADLLWGHCAVCRQCYCPMGIDLSGMMSFGRSILRSQNIDGWSGSYED